MIGRGHVVVEAAENEKKYSRFGCGMWLTPRGWVPKDPPISELETLRHMTLNRVQWRSCYYFLSNHNGWKDVRLNVKTVFHVLATTTFPFLLFYIIFPTATFISLRKKTPKGALQAVQRWAAMLTHTHTHQRIKCLFVLETTTNDKTHATKIVPVVTGIEN